MFGKTDVVRYLVSKGAYKNVKDEYDKTPYDVTNDFYFGSLSDKSQIIF